MRKPNIILILTDQHRRDFLGCYGSVFGRSPNLDALAAEGVVFDNAYTVTPVCTPARASLQTGLYPCKHGMQNNLFQPGCVVHELADTPRVLSRRLRGAGYRAGYTGKWHLGYGKDAYEDPWYREHVVEGAVDVVAYPAFYRSGSSLPTDLGYEGDDFPGHGGGGHHYKQYRDYLAARGLKHVLKGNREGYAEVVSPPASTIDHFLTERAKDLLGKLATKPEPFFFMLSYWGPHAPAYVPTAFLEPYRDVPIPPWPSFAEAQTDKPHIHNAKRNRGDWSRWVDKIRYAGAYCEYIDHEIGRLIRYLKTNGLYDGSYIIMSADHGDSLGIHAGLADKGFFMYEETCTVPLIIKPPKGMALPGRTEAFTNTTDIYATILAAAGAAPAANDGHGRSLLPLLAGKKPGDWPDVVVTEHTGLGYLACSQRMLRKGDFKYVFNCADTYVLYNLAVDPHELVNLAGDAAYRMKLIELQRELSVWLKKHDDRLLQSFHMLRPAAGAKQGEHR